MIWGQLVASPLSWSQVKDHFLFSLIFLSFSNRDNKKKLVSWEAACHLIQQLQDKKERGAEQARQDIKNNNNNNNNKEGEKKQIGDRMKSKNLPPSFVCV